MPYSYYTQAFARDYIVAQQGAQRWGTGVNPVHAYRANPPYLQMRVPPDSQLPQNITPANMGVPDFITEQTFGYQPEDIAGLDVFTESATLGIPVVNDFDWPELGRGTTQVRGNIPPQTNIPWHSGRLFKNAIHRIRAGQHDEDYKASNQIPTETVNEGWVNKLGSGFDIGHSGDMVKPSSPDQYERQTSMQQRFKTLNNNRALGRSADEPRTSIDSRIVPMKTKVYSGDQRHYDMFPFQIDDIPRPFRYRTFGTGPQTYLETNEQFQRMALQRTPPPDAGMGTPDLELSSAYDYESEDMGYY